MAKYRNGSLKEATNILKALADTNRLRTIMALEASELCVCQIIELLHLAPSTVSKHLYILRQAGLIKSSKKGRWVHCSLVPPGANRTAQETFRWLKESLADDATMAQDRKLLKEILRQDPEQLCLKIKKR